MENEMENDMENAVKFEDVIKKLSQQVTLRGQSKSTLSNYTRRIALFVIHFKKYTKMYKKIRKCKEISQNLYFS